MNLNDCSVMSYQTIKLELAIHGQKHSNLIFKNNEASSKMQNIEVGRLKDALHVFIVLQKAKCVGSSC